MKKLILLLSLLVAGSANAQEFLTKSACYWSGSVTKCLPTGGIDISGSAQSLSVGSNTTLGATDSSSVSTLVQGNDSTNGTLHVKAASSTAQIKVERTGTAAGSIWIGSSSGNFYVGSTAGGSEIIGGGTAGLFIKGTTTNDNAAAGYVGEYKESLQSTLTSAGATSAWFDAMNIVLTAGDWSCDGAIEYSRNGAVYTGSGTSPDLEAGFTGSAGTSFTGAVNGVTEFGLWGQGSITTTWTVYTIYVPRIRVQSNGTDLFINGVTFSGTQTLRLKSYPGAYTTATPQYQGRAACWRVR